MSDFRALSRLLLLFVVVLTTPGHIAAAATKTSKVNHTAATSIPSPLPDPWANAGTRADRFPSAEERLKIYMSNWYLPPCAAYNPGKIVATAFQKNHTTSWQIADRPDRMSNHHSNNNSGSSLTLASKIVPDTLFFLDESNVDLCAAFDDDKHNATNYYPSRIVFPHNMRMYCQDVVDSVLPAWKKTQMDASTTNTSNNNNSIPLLVQFGDLKHSHEFGMIQIPHLKKFRSAAASPAALEQVTTLSKTKSSNNDDCYDTPRPALSTVHSDKNDDSVQHFQPIVWKLATNRHFRLAYKVYREDTPWKKKRNLAVFRGQLTGAELYNKTLDYVTNCRRITRCRLVYESAGSKLISARLTNTRNRFPDVLEGRPLLGDKVSMRQLLTAKALILLEGNDVASGLKWALLSQSVVLMPPPTHTSWAMEELLEPWVHYIPLTPELDDVGEKMEWIIAHDAQARAIAQRGSLWMEDLVFHPDAAEDDAWIQGEIVQRYRAHFKSGEES